MKIRNTKALSIASVILYPLSSLLLSAYFIQKNKFFGYTLLAFFLASLSVLLPPMGDVYRYYGYYQTYKSVSFSDFVLNVNADFLLYLIIWSFANIGLKFEFIRFFLTFILLLLGSKVFYEIYDKYRPPKPLLLFFLFLSVIDWFSYVVGFRSSYANILMILSLYYVFIKNDIKLGLFWSVIAICMHLSMMLFCVMMLISKIVKANISDVILIFAVVVFVFLPIDWIKIASLLDQLPMIDNRLTDYVSTDKELEFFSGESWLFYINSMRYTYFISLPLALMLFSSKSARCKDLRRFLLCMYLFLITIFKFHTLFDRFQFVTFTMTFLYLMIVDVGKLKHKFFVFCCVLVLAITLFNAKLRFYFGETGKFVRGNIVTVLSNKFDDNWIYQHLDDKGDFYNE